MGYGTTRRCMGDMVLEGAVWGHRVIGGSRVGSKGCGPRRLPPSFHRITKVGKDLKDHPVQPFTHYQ